MTEGGAKEGNRIGYCIEQEREKGIVIKRVEERER